uniref:Uncharacterized protein n=1 Tax=Anguilla anguilla TaxID=7936 RepID=A0A0E9XYR7_ANGAN
MLRGKCPHGDKEVLYVCMYNMYFTCSIYCT